MSSINLGNALNKEDFKVWQKHGGSHKYSNDCESYIIVRVLRKILCLCLWFRALLNYINNCPTSCNTKQYICYSASSLYMFRVSTTPIITSTQNCNRSLRYWPFFCAATSLQRGQASLEGGSCTKKYDKYRRLQLQFFVLLMMGVVDTRNM